MAEGPAGVRTKVECGVIYPVSSYRHNFFLTFHWLTYALYCFSTTLEDLTNGINDMIEKLSGTIPQL